ncbi:MAG: YggS family pyridoxal phosphate-dependent enzyme [Planctomycetes bacterium]|nr:YggS family pyridoxal phosphate-dependent enzyme [Planctomycetota bacterium]
MSINSEEVTKRYLNLKDEIENISIKTGRKGNIKIVAITKYLSDTDFATLKQTPIREIGESRIQTAAKRFNLCKDFKWHMVGHIQTNKIKDLLNIFSVVHSVDRTELVSKIQSRLNDTGRHLESFIQVNIFNEPQKSGVSADKVDETICYSREHCKNIKLVGLMCMAPYDADDEKIREGFKQLRKLSEQHKLQELSMGMSNDYKIAIEEGATIVRIGRYLWNH